MAKFLRILPASQTTTTNGSALINPNTILYVSASADNTLTIQVNNLDTNADVIVITFSASDSSRRVHRTFIDAICGAASDYDLPALISGAGTALTINSIVYS
jgi:hypothetical protein